MRLLSALHCLQVVCEVSDGLEAVQKAEELKPDSYITLAHSYFRVCMGLQPTYMDENYLESMNFDGVGGDTTGTTKDP